MIERSSDFETAFTQWLEQAQQISDDYMSKHFPNLSKPKLTFTRGAKRIRVERDSSAHCFIDIATGDVLKAASYSTHAKGARGNIYNPNQPGVTAYGGIYKR